jgi:hypothetical protein
MNRATSPRQVTAAVNSMPSTIPTALKRSSPSRARIDGMTR